MLTINVPLKEDNITPLTNMCYYCKNNISGDIVRDHDHLNAKFRGYARNKCKLQAKNNFAPINSFNSTNYDNHLLISKLAKKNTKGIN